MARPGLDKHPKFRRLMHMLGERKSHVRGYLECLWETAYETGNPVIGDDVDIELAADWPGEPGKLATALLTCGGDGRVGFIEEVVTDCNALNNGLRNSVTKTFQVHDLFDHAPEYVTHRRTKEAERRKEKRCQRCGNEFHSTETHAKFCSDTCRVSAYRERHSVESTTGQQDPVTDGNAALRNCNAPLRTVTGSNEPPAPAPAPALQLGLGSGVPEPLSDGADVSHNGEKKKKHDYCRTFDLWWKTYPRREGKLEAYRAWTKAGKKLKDRFDGNATAAAQFLQDRAAAYAASNQVASRDRDKIPHPSTWLNGGRYDDDQEAWESQPAHVASRVATIPTGGRPIYNPETGEIVLAKE